MEEGGEGFLHVLRALRDAARRVEEEEEAGYGETRARGPALQALLALDAGADDLLAPTDPDLAALRRLLRRLSALSCSLDLLNSGSTPLSLSLRARCRRCAARRAVARAAGAVADEIQAWVDRESIARLVAALRCRRRSDAGAGADAAAAAAATARGLLAELEARLASASSAGGRFDPRLQRALLGHGVFAAVEGGLVGDPDPTIRDGCAAAVVAMVRFNRDVFVGPVLMGPAVGALVASSSSESAAALSALNGLVDAVRTPLVDELHARGELPRLVALLCAAPATVSVQALGFVFRVGYYGRKEVVDALLAEGLVKRLLCLQRSHLGGALADTDEDEDEDGDGSPKAKRPDDGKPGGSLLLLGCLPLGWRRRGGDGDGDGETETEERPFVGAVARFAVQVEVGVGLSPREKRETKLEILRRVREAAVSPAEEATVLAEVLWGATP